MMTDGVVKAKDERGITVKVDPTCGESHGQCESHGKSGGGCACCGGGTDKTLDVYIETTAPLSVGDAVRVDLTMPNEAVVALTVFGLPLAGVIGGAVLGHLSQPGDELALIVGGVVGFAAGFVLVNLASRLSPGLQAHAKLVE